MSYILNALRKSEQERNPESVAMHQVLPQRATDQKHQINLGWIITVLVALLVAFNLVFLGYLWQAGNEYGSAKPAQNQVETPIINTPIPVETPVVQKPGSNTAISDWVAAREKILPVASPKTYENKAPDLAQEQLKKFVTKPVITKTESKSLPTKRPIMPEDELIEKPVASMEWKPKQIQVKPIPEIRSEPKVIDSGIRLLRDLDTEFQRKVPTVTINVLAYDDEPSARFAIIDMVKYRIGQRIEEELLLIDILPDSLVLNYAGRDFRIDRP